MLNIQCRNFPSLFGVQHSSFDISIPLFLCYSKSTSLLSGFSAFSSKTRSSGVQISFKALFSHSSRSLRTLYKVSRPKPDRDMMILRLSVDEFVRIIRPNSAKWANTCDMDCVVMCSVAANSLGSSSPCWSSYAMVERSVSESHSPVLDCLRSFLVNRVIRLRRLAANCLVCWSFIFI